MSKELLDRIETFLSEPKEPEPCEEWPEVTNDDMQELRSIFREIIKSKFGTDYKENSPVEFAIVNRHVGRFLVDPYFMTIPSWYDLREDKFIHDPLEHLGPIDRLQFVLSAVSHELNSVIRIHQDAVREKIEKMKEAELQS